MFFKLSLKIAQSTERTRVPCSLPQTFTWPWRLKLGAVSVIRVPTASQGAEIRSWSQLSHPATPWTGLVAVLVKPAPVTLESIQAQVRVPAFVLAVQLCSAGLRKAVEHGQGFRPLPPVWGPWMKPLLLPRSVLTNACLQRVTQQLDVSVQLDFQIN